MNRTTLTAVGTLALFASSAQAITFFDGTFNNADWSLIQITNAAGAGSLTAGFQLPSGGNGGSYRLIRNNLVISGVNATIIGVHMNNFDFYNPSGGAISAINYSEDSKNFVNQGGNGQGSGAAIIQGGKIYLQRNPILVMPYSGYSNWTANPAPGLTASDFYEVDMAGNINAFSNPDFTVSGGTMQFGFYRGNSSGNLSSGTFNTECGIDNWNIDIQTTPAPASLALLGAAGMLSSRRRR